MKVCSSLCTSYKIDIGILEQSFLKINIKSKNVAKLRSLYIKIEIINKNDNNVTERGINLKVYNM